MALINEIDTSEKFDEKITRLSKQIEDSNRILKDRTSQILARDLDDWEKQTREHKIFEDRLQALDSEASMVQELFRQIPSASPMQRTRRDQFLGRWKELWESSGHMAERLRTHELVLNGLSETSQIANNNEATLAAFNPMSPKFDELCAVHAQLLEIQLILQQQQPIFSDLKNNIAILQQNVARTRTSFGDQSDVSRLKEEVKTVSGRWDAICAQVIERLRSTEVCLQRLMVYHAQYQNELNWVNNVEETISQLRTETLRSEKYQDHLDVVEAEHSQLSDRARAVEKVNLDGRKFIADARVYDTRLSQFKNLLGSDARKGMESLRRRMPSPAEIGADVVDHELNELNKRFSLMSSLLTQRRSHLQSMINKKY